jgi:hypothetical protein
MSKRKSSTGVMLDLWRPPQGAGEAIGCLATTYTFDPGLFDEQCLGRFLEIESEPDREDLAFLLERESRLGGVYAGVLVDHRQAGVEHSLRWDVLRVRLSRGKQHAKLSLLAWKGHIRIIVASANLTESGYRVNQEVAGCIDITPADFDRENFDRSLTFLRTLLNHVPAPIDSLPEVQRAESFLERVKSLVGGWKPTSQLRGVRRRLVFTLPPTAAESAHSTLDETIAFCRTRGGSPNDVWIASPFFDVDDETSRVTAALCKSMARGTRRRLHFCVPAIRDSSSTALPRLAAPKALLLVPRTYQSDVMVEMLPARDLDKVPRPWHAKMIALYGQDYAALLFGSSNFTGAGLGVGQYRNAEANLLMVLDQSLNREVAQLNAIWPQMEPVRDPESAEWMGPRPELEEEERALGTLLPAGFVAATYSAGEHRLLVLSFDPERLPEEDWQVYACGPAQAELLSASTWLSRGAPSEVSLSWTAPDPPHKLLVRWKSSEAFLPINVDDSRALPPPTQLQNMTADDMLMILAAADPSAAFRIWVRQQANDSFDPDLDSATPADLDPLRRYDLKATFLHRVRRRARILAQVRANLERPVYSRQALDWRLRGLLGVEALAERLVRDVKNSNGHVDEAILTLADLLIVLREVTYEPAEGALSADEFKLEYDNFLKAVVNKIRCEIEFQGDQVPDDVVKFWERVLKTCLS